MGLRVHYASPDKDFAASDDGATAQRAHVISKREVRARLYGAMLAADSAAIVSGFGFAAITFAADRASVWGFQLSLLMLPIFFSLAARDYVPETLVNWRAGLFGACSAIGGSFVAALILASLMHIDIGLSGPAMMAGLGFSSAGLIVMRAVHGWASRRLLHDYALETILLLDGLDVCVPDGVNVVDAAPIGIASGVQHPLVLDRLAQAIGHADRLYVACAPERRATWSMALRGSGLQVELLVPELGMLGALGTSVFADTPTITITTGKMRARDEIAKRAFDLGLSSFLLALCLPLFCLVALLVKATSEGSVFFVQKRVGRRNRLFNVIKFRTMRADLADLDGSTSAHRSDARVTPVGRILRASSLDEIPQLFNILRGEMSFVGPRPHAVGSLAGDKLFWEIDHRYHYRHACKPGLTGLAQVRGYRGATLRREDLVNRLRADLEYINRWSLRRDLRIAVATVWVLIRRDPVSVAHPTPERRRFRALTIDTSSQADAVQRIVSAVEGGSVETFGFCNMHTYNLLRRSSDFARSLRGATIFNDGVGMDIATRLVHGRRFPDNLNGTDLVPRVLDRLGRSSTVFLIGSAPGVAERAAERLCATHPGIEVVGCHHGFTTEAEDARLAAEVRASGARLLLLGMGNPRQELWAERFGERSGAVTLCVGAFIDFAAGVVPRAPLWVRRLRCEWLFRLMLEPRRMFRRYVTGGIRFAAAIAAERFAPGEPARITEVPPPLPAIEQVAEPAAEQIKSDS